MKRVILSSAPGADLKRDGKDIADVVIPFAFRFVWGQLPSPDKLAGYLGKGSGKHARGNHWSDYVSWSRDVGPPPMGLVEFCMHFDVVELWFDSMPNDQLLQIWLLDHLRHYPDILSRVKVGLLSFKLIEIPLEGLRKWEVPTVGVSKDEPETAGVTWQAYRAATPQACVDVLARNMSSLLLLRPALHELLNELPSRTTGLGATEMRMLEMIAWGYANTNPLFYLRALRGTRVFDDSELGYLLEGLAHGPTPAVAGLDDELRILEKKNRRDRDKAFKRSRLSLTELGKAIVAHREDFSRHNPIHRWWGSTELTNDRLWRWAPVLTAP